MSVLDSVYIVLFERMDVRIRPYRYLFVFFYCVDDTIKFQMVFDTLMMECFLEIQIITYNYNW
jgi:hypothetical protein